jgi:cytochrome c556
MGLSTRAAVTAALLSCSTCVAADQGAIDYRQAVYKSIGGHMSAIAGVLKRDVPHGADLAVHAAGVAALAPLTRHLFPPGSDGGRTRARAAVWEDPFAFAERREAFIAAAAAFGTTDASDMEAFVDAFRMVGGTCKACHDDFKDD